MASNHDEPEEDHRSEEQIKADNDNHANQLNPQQRRLLVVQGLFQEVNDLKKECWCPICGQKTRSGKVCWLWFWVFLFFITPAFPFYLLYCLFTRKRVCERCHNRVKFYSEKDDFEREYNGKI